MRKRNETRKFRKLRKGSKNYSTRRNKSGGTLGTFARSFTSDGRLLEEFKTNIRNVREFQELLDDPNNNMREKTRAITIAADTQAVNTSPAYKTLKKFVDDNIEDLDRVLNSNMTIKKREFYKKVMEEVVIIRLGVGAGATNGAAPPISSGPPGPSMGDDGSEGKIITKSDGKKIYVDSSLLCGVYDQGKRHLNDEEDQDPGYFTSDIGKGENLDNLRCKFCFKSKIKHIHIQGQGGGSRRRRRTTRKNKTRRNGKCRACRCPGGCKRSTCPCYRGRSKPCCTKRCKSRGRICRC